MSHKLRAVLATLAFVCLASVGWADTSDWTKVSQLPDMTSGWNLQSQWDVIDGEPNIIRADNWLCTDGLPVTDIHWWGSYFFNSRQSDNPAVNGPVEGFEISIFANDPGTNLPSTLAGGLLYRHVFDISEVNETLIGPDGNGENVYQYFVDLDPQTYFRQQQGEIYWLSIVAVTEGAKRWPMWGWHTAENAHIDELLGSAQTTKDPTADEGPVLGGGGGKKSNPWQADEYDLAFELTTVPEPSLVALFGLGLFAAWRRFRRQ
jgi:hypothetical protein